MRAFQEITQEVAKNLVDGIGFCEFNHNDNGTFLYQNLNVQFEQLEVEQKQVVWGVLKCKPGCKSLCCQTLISKSQNKQVIVHKGGSWQNPKKIPLTRFKFDNYQIKQIGKIKYLRKLQPYSDTLKDNLHIMKVMINQVSGDIVYSSYAKIMQEYFMKIIFARFKSSQVDIPQDFDMEQKISGTVLKKSDYLGSWQDIYMTIDGKQGIKCYKNKESSQNKKPILQVRYIKQIWTWFEVYDDKYVIIKFKKNNTKRQFAILMKELVKWMPGIMSLLDREQGGQKKKQDKS